MNVSLVTLGRSTLSYYKSQVGEEALYSTVLEKLTSVGGISLYMLLLALEDGSDITDDAKETIIEPINLILNKLSNPEIAALTDSFIISVSELPFGEISPKDVSDLLPIKSYLKTAQTENNHVFLNRYTLSAILLTELALNKNLRSAINDE